MTAGGEQILLLGPSDGPLVIVSPPLFEEANRTRTIIVGILRRLAARGLGGALPDLPGTGESLRPSETATLVDWRRAFAQQASSFAGHRPVHIVAVRGGALVDVDAEATSRWYCSPVGGAALVREMLRARAAAEPGAPPVVIAEEGTPVELAGNLVSRAMLRELEAAQIVPAPPIRVVRLTSDPAPADRKIEATAPWRRSEPTDDPALAEMLAADIADWIATCAA